MPRDGKFGASNPGKYVLGMRVVQERTRKETKGTKNQLRKWLVRWWEKVAFQKEWQTSNRDSFPIRDRGGQHEIENSERVSDGTRYKKGRERRPK